MSAYQDYLNYKGIHAGEAIIICGCGKSLADFNAHESFITIGVNDIGRRFHPTYLLVLNSREQFWGQRFTYVENSKATAIFTHLDLELSHPNIIKIPLGTFEGTNLKDARGIHYTKNSPYAAINLAAYMGARLIGLIGVDFTDDHFFARTGSHHLSTDLPNIDRQYARLYSSFDNCGIELFNLSEHSRLLSIPKSSINHFTQRKSALSRPSSTNNTRMCFKQRLRIVSYATTPLAGVPAILSRCINAMTPHECRCVWQYHAYSNGVSFKGDVQWNDNPSEASSLLTNADVIIVHNGKVDPRHRSIINSKPIITMAHNYMWNVDTTYTDLGYPGIVVGQYQSTLDEFHNWSIVPNPVPIWEEEFSPGTKSDRITICYTPSGNHGVYSNDHRLYWHSKGKPQTLKILDELSRSYNINISAILDRPVPHSTSLQMKRSAHIVIDECVTGSYHRNSLEGLSVGCVVVNGLGLKHDIVNALHRCTESDDTPFIFASLDTLYETLSSLIQRGSTELTEFGRHNREWMEDHWDFKSQWSTHWEHVIAASLDQTSTLD